MNWLISAGLISGLGRLMSAVNRVMFSYRAIFRQLSVEKPKPK